MNTYIGQIALLVRDYDEAIAYYSAALGFCLIEDTVLSDTKRWVVMSSSNGAEKGCRVLLAKASGSVQEEFIGNQSGGRVFLFLYTDSFEDFHRNLLNHEVEVVNGPRDEAYGRVLVFRDMYGNLWDLISTMP
ncbi:MAG: VOC family protein [Flavobacteriaceae bacterium]